MLWQTQLTQGRLLVLHVQPLKKPLCAARKCTFSGLIMSHRQSVTWAQFPADRHFLRMLRLPNTVDLTPIIRNVPRAGYCVRLKVAEDSWHFRGLRSINKLCSKAVQNLSYSLHLKWNQEGKDEATLTHLSVKQKEPSASPFCKKINWKPAL